MLCIAVAGENSGDGLLKIRNLTRTLRFENSYTYNFGELGENQQR
jgi:hypothetical protein